MRRLLIVILVVVSACSSGPDAPPVAAGGTSCAEAFCVSHPADWQVETGDDFLAFVHPLDPAGARATTGRVSMESLVTSAGNTWPANHETVVRSLWQLLDEGGSAELATVTVFADGSVRSFGAFGDGRMWYMLVPRGPSDAIGFEVRGPNSSWESHADAFFDGFVLVP